MMILGIYWSLGFPETLYHFEYFKFRKALGGLAGSPAALEAIVSVEHPKRLVDELESLIEKFEDGFLMVKQEGQNLQISTGSYCLFDYDFLMIEQVEKRLQREKAKRLPFGNLQPETILRLAGKNHAYQPAYPGGNIFQVVGSELKKHNAEHLSLRLDCHLKTRRKLAFIAHLKTIVDAENLNIFYYNQQVCEDEINLMLFFTNGRQGLDLQPKKQTDVSRFETKIKRLMQMHKATIGHLGGLNYYPKNQCEIVKMVDRDYIL